ncbi:phosphotransferase [Arthrobacter sp. zg-Y916]|uniref:phosphotransferase n=1 Tax=Arthrobacter sp. zg-Y916 TaxID=2894190 RepID=UPI001E45BD32|nr:phosphotransferase [Arthrobacter sp. zg-Y916]MCC9192717.1 phosphotransferase [Arthrobacter sp. zg-Y916]
MAPPSRGGRNPSQRDPRSRAAVHDGPAARDTVESSGMSVPIGELLTRSHLVLDSWSHQRTFHRPGAGVSALYRIRAINRGGATLSLYAGATTSRTPLSAPAAVRTSLNGTPLSLWLHPYDPLLPSLAWALDPGQAAARIFERPQLTADGAGLRLAAYRPLRRAVVHAAVPGQNAYIKVLQLGQEKELILRHRLLAGTAVPAAGLVPPPGAAGTWPGGAVVLSELHGAPMLRALESGAAPGPEELSGLLDQLPEAALSLKRRPAWSERARAYGRSAAAVLPGQAGRISAMARKIEELTAALDPGPVVPVHGDFYEGNLLVDGGRITGVLDVDGMGPGHRVDDLACFTGHLAVLAELAPGSALEQALADYRQGFDAAAAAAGSSPEALAARAAGVALSLVPGARAGRLTRAENAAARLEAAAKLLSGSRGQDR